MGRGCDGETGDDRCEEEKDEAPGAGSMRYDVLSLSLGLGMGERRRLLSRFASEMMAARSREGGLGMVV